MGGCLRQTSSLPASSGMQRQDGKLRDGGDSGLSGYLHHHLAARTPLPPSLPSSLALATGAA